MKKRCFRKLILLLLVTLFISSQLFSLTINAVSSDVPEDYVPSTETTEDSNEAFSIEAKDEILLKQELGELTFEIESMREENVKHLRLEDGTFLAVVYGDSVHRKSSEGEWEEIDNSLYEINGALSTSDGRVKFAKQTTDLASLFTLQEGNYKVSFGLKNAKEDTAVAVTNAKTEPDIDATKLQRLTTVEKITSSIIYENIVDNTDIEYILVSNSIKENIIVKKPSRTYDYSFTLSLDGLVAELNGGDIILSDSDTREVVYQIPAPYMYDAVNEYSTKVAYSISPLGPGKYEFTISADADWVNADGRVFPVTIDPSLVDIGQTADTYVYSAYPTVNYGGEHQLWVSNSQQTFYQFTTPNLPSGVNITSANVSLPYYYSVINYCYMSVGIYQITSNWSEYGVTWNNKPTTAPTCSDIVDVYADGVNEANPEYAVFSVTNYVKSWYTGTSNYGFALKREGGENYSVVFVAKEKMQIFAQLTINYTGTHFAEGVYAVRKANTNTYVKAYRPVSLAWVLQDSTSYTSPPLSVSHLENLFKISYRPATNDYVIRSMLESSLVIFPSVGNNAPVAGRLAENDAELSTDYTWKLVYTSGNYYITYTENGVTYYVRSTSANNNTILVLTTNPGASGTKWSFHKYLGNTYENIVAEDFPPSLSLDETYQYHAYMQSTRINHNGPVSYSVTDTDGSSTTRATINASTGVLTTLFPGKIQVRVTYPGAPWIWCWNVSIDGTFVDEVPTNLRSSQIHLCIPCAITNIAAFWCINHGMLQFDCIDEVTQELRAIEVQAAMINGSGHEDGHGENDNIQFGFDIFVHEDDGTTYTLESENVWRGTQKFSWNTIQSELDAGRPIMLGFGPGSQYPDPHMTVCVGYKITNDGYVVYVSDAHQEQYRDHLFSSSTYNDFFAIVLLVQE